MENKRRWFTEAAGVKESKGNHKITNKYGIGNIGKTYILCHATS